MTKEPNSDTSPEAGEREIEITEAMIEAAIGALVDTYGDEYEVIARAVLEAALGEGARVAR